MNKPATFLLLANGDLPCSLLKQVNPLHFQQIVACDGGGEKALNCGLQPSVIIGDLDSISKELPRRYPQIRFIKQASQEMNDLEKALIYCREQGAQRLVVLGTVSAERLDHSINNFSVLARYHHSFDMQILTGNSRIYLLDDHLVLPAKPGTLVSLIPLGRVENIETRGLQYSLNKESLVFGEREGLSNVIIENPAEIRVGSGVLLVFLFIPPSASVE
ncbi:MAG: thiamine diphosphokinase [Calditrichia bacterium]